MTTGEKIRVLREAKGFSQKALAARASVSQSMVALIELGKADPSLGSLDRIAKALGVSFQIVFLPQEKVA